MGAEDLWRVAFDQWDALTEPDLLQVFGLDMADPAAWDRPWSSLVSLILALLDVGEARLTRALRRLQEERTPAAAG